MRGLIFGLLIVVLLASCDHVLGPVPSAAQITCVDASDCPDSWTCQPNGRCRLTTCGNGEPDPGEECDFGVFNSDTTPNNCRTDCQRSHCGDGVLDAGEACDDGDNFDNGDGCSETCTRLGYCGDGTIQAAMESCEDGNSQNGDGCSNDCITEVGMQLIGSGIFSMGSPAGEAGRVPDEELHNVRLTRDFFIGVHEVTQSEYENLMGDNPSAFGPNGGNASFCEPVSACPGEQVSWFDAIRYANAMSLQAGLPKCYRLQRGAGLFAEMTVDFVGLRCLGYRLPTEAEWEYAARAGTRSAFSSGVISVSGEACGYDTHLEKIGWYCDNAGISGPNAGTNPIMGKQANSWGLYDMSGNVYEWVWDLYSPTYGIAEQTDPLGAVSGSLRVNRGGSWYSNPRYCRSAYRRRDSPDNRGDFIGMRISRTAP